MLLAEIFDVALQRLKEAVIGTALALTVDSALISHAEAAAVLLPALTILASASISFPDLFFLGLSHSLGFFSDVLRTIDLDHWLILSWVEEWMILFYMVMMTIEKGTNSIPVGLFELFSVRLRLGWARGFFLGAIGRTLEWESEGVRHQVSQTMYRGTDGQRLSSPRTHIASQPAPQVQITMINQAQRLSDQGFSYKRISKLPKNAPFAKKFIINQYKKIMWQSNENMPKYRHDLCGCLSKDLGYGQKGFCFILFIVFILNSQHFREMRLQLIH